MPQHKVFRMFSSISRTIQSSALPKAQTSKKPKKATAELGLPDNQASDGDIDKEEETHRQNKSTSKHLASALLQSDQKATRSSNSRSNAFSTQRKAIYAETRKNAKEIVQANVKTLEGIRAQLENLRGQELPFQKHREDCALPLLTQKNVLQDMDGFYMPILKELGPARSEQVNGANRMLRNNDEYRQKALDNSSRKARHQLELTRQMEKDAVDARKLIEHTKNLLRLKPAQKSYRKQFDRD